MRLLPLALPLVLLVGCSTDTGATTAAQCRAITENAQAAPDTTGGSGERVAVLGDSWSTGWKLARPTDGWNYRLAASRGWRTTMLAVAGSGYVQASACGADTFDTRVDRVPADTQVVLIEGGLNDVRDAPDAPGVQAAASALFTALRQQAPEATLVVLGVPDTVARDDALTAQANKGLLAAAESAGARFLPIGGDGVELQPDGLHPTAAGHAAYARLVDSALAG